MNAPNGSNGSKSLIPAKAFKAAPAAIAPAFPVPPLPAARPDTIIPIASAVLPQGDKAGPALGFDFQKQQVTENTNLVPKDGLCTIYPPEQLTKRYLWVYLWFENTAPANVGQILGEIILNRNRSLIGKFPFGDSFPASATDGDAVINLSSGVTPGSLEMNSLWVRPIKPTANEPGLSVMAPIVFNAEIDEIKANLLTVNSNVSSYRLILACLSTSP